jgi:hypothetical protein
MGREGAVYFSVSFTLPLCYAGAKRWFKLAKINDWCNRTDSKVKAHSLIYFEADRAKLSTAVADVAAIVPGHYTAANRVAHILDKLGKAEAAEYVATKLPTRLESAPATSAKSWLRAG